MKKSLMILAVLLAVSCSHREVKNSAAACLDGSSCYHVRIVHDVIEQKGISQPELMDLSACDENSEFYRVKRYGNLSESFFYGANERACAATLYGCQ